MRSTSLPAKRTTSCGNGQASDQAPNRSLRPAPNRRRCRARSSVQTARPRTPVLAGRPAPDRPGRLRAPRNRRARAAPRRTRAGPRGRVRPPAPIANARALPPARAATGRDENRWHGESETARSSTHLLTRRRVRPAALTRREFNRAALSNACPTSAGINQEVYPSKANRATRVFGSCRVRCRWRRTATGAVARPTLTSARACALV